MIALKRRITNLERSPHPIRVLTAEMARHIAAELGIDPAILLESVGVPLRDDPISHADLASIAVSLGIDPAIL